jgi:TetR/AcrR family transcriptional regulator, cholesterol catabolism regulator
MATQVRTEAVGRRAAAVRRRQQLLDTAARLFAAQGAASTSMGEIAAEAGVTKGLLHYYFGSKAELLSAILQESELRSRIERIPELTRDLPLSVTLPVILTRSIEVMRERRDFVKLLFLEAAQSRPEAEAIYRELIDVWVDHIASVFARATAAGEIRLIDPRIAAQQVVDVLLARFHWTEIARRPSNPDETDAYMHQLADVVIRGLSPGGAETPPMGKEGRRR